MRKTILAAVLVAVLAPNARGEETLVKDYGVLAGLKGVYVVVKSIKVEDSKVKLTKDAVLGESNSVLRRGGIPVLSARGRDELNHGATLSIVIHVWGSDVRCTFSHWEVVSFSRNPEMKMLAWTWRKESYTKHNGEPGDILRAVENLTAVFVYDYLRANPKKAPEPVKKK